MMMSRFELGPKIIDDFLLPLETPGTWQRRCLLVWLLVPIGYFSLHLFVIDTSSALVVAVIFAAVACFSFYSLVWTQPLHIVLGRRRTQQRPDIDGGQDVENEAEPATMSLALITPSSNDIFQRHVTPRVMAYTNFVAFVMMFGGDLYFFLTMARQEDAATPLLIAVYTLGSFSSNVALGMGLAYAALVHNILTAELEDVAHALEQRGGGGHASGGLESEHSLLLEQQQQQPLKATTLGKIHSELRRRQDALAEAFTPRLTLGITAFSIVVILAVRAGFQEESDEFTQRQMAALIIQFLGNSYSLWTATYTMGRVAFTSREETAYKAMQRALEDPGGFTQVAQAMTLFPIVLHVGPFEWGTEVTKAYTIFLLSLAGIFVGIEMPEFE